MADRYDKSFTRRSNPPEPGPAAPQDDPLVELARIVSGNQSFDDLVGRPAQSARPAPRAPQPAPRAATRDLSFDLESELLNDLQSSFDPSVRAAAARPEPTPPPRQAQPQPPMREAYEAPRQRPVQPPAPNWTSPRDPVDDDPYSGTAYAADDRGPAPDPLAASRVFGRGRAQPAPAEEPAAADYDDDYYDDAEPQYDDGEFAGDDRYSEYDGYEGEPAKRSRRPLIIAAVVLAIALVGGVAALALKGQSPTGSAQAPKVIAADPGPTKVEPAVQPAEQDGQQNKLIYDRANPDAQPEQQLVLPDDGAISAPPASGESAGSREISRIILPGAPGDGSSADGGASAEAPAAADSQGSDTEPRKVRTVVIRPDGTIVSSEARAKGAAPASDAASDAVAANDAASAPAVPATSDNAAPAADMAAAPAAAPADDAASAPAAVATGPEVAPDLAPAAPSAAPEPAVANPSASAPAKDPSQLAPPKQAAQKAVPKPAPADTEVASAAGAGGFMVQVSAQRSQDQAVAAFRSLQRTYPSLLANRQPDILRVDLGAKGIYYRARVGPMATRDEAIQFCGALKAAGGDCIVQKN